MRRGIAALLASALSCVLVAFAAAWVAEAAGSAAGRALGESADDLAATDPGDDEGPSIAELAELGGASPIDLPRGWIERVEMPARAPAGHAPAAGVKAPSSAAEPVLGILVRASAVRAAIARGGRPSGSAIGEEGDRPAGLVLSGVSAYGTALRDGDLLTRIGGTAATSEGRVIAAVSGAIRSRAKAIDGEIWRAGRRIPFVVELPHRKKRR